MTYAATAAILLYLIVRYCAFMITQKRQARVAPAATTPDVQPIWTDVDDPEDAERAMTRRLLDGTLTPQMYHRTMEALAARDAARHPMRIPAN